MGKDTTCLRSGIKFRIATPGHVLESIDEWGRAAWGQVGTLGIENNAVTTPKIGVNFISSLDGVINKGGNIDLVAGSNVTITPNDPANTITISATPGSGGGDITAVEAGLGLTGGGTSGDVTRHVGAGNGINVAANDVSVDYGTGLNMSSGTLVARTGEALWNANQLRGRTVSSTAPTSNQVLKWNGSAWSPANDATGGDITAVYAGNGLTGGATSGPATLNIGDGDGISVSTSSIAVRTRYSVTTGSDRIQLIGDSDTPGNSRYYGTNSSGTKGWYSLSSVGDNLGNHTATQDLRMSGNRITHSGESSGGMLVNSTGRVIINDDTANNLYALTIRANSVTGIQRGLYVSTNSGGYAALIEGYPGQVPTGGLLTKSYGSGTWALEAQADGDGGCLLTSGPGEVRLQNSGGLANVEGILYFGTGDDVNVNRQSNDLLIGALSGKVSFITNTTGETFSLNHLPSTSAGSTVRYYNNHLYQMSSSRRYKENISPFSDDFRKILHAEPKIFNYKGGPQLLSIGYIAEEFDQLGLDHLVSYNQDNQPESINYEMISLYLPSRQRNAQHRPTTTAADRLVE